MKGTILPPKYLDGFDGKKILRDRQGKEDKSDEELAEPKNSLIDVSKQLTIEEIARGAIDE